MRLPFISLLYVLLASLTACSGVRGGAPTSLTQPSATGLHGRVLDSDGNPVAAAKVYVYRNPRSGLRGPADFAAESARDGSYALDLVPGSYHLVARLRSQGGESGPPRPGDAWALPAENPVVLSEGEMRRLDFTLRQVGDQRTLASVLSAAPFAFSGQALRGDGTPLAGTLVLAYRQPDLHRRPDFAASPADRDGRFTLYLPDPGPWCLVFRQNTRGQLRSGELHTLLGREEGACRLQARPHQELGAVILTPFSGS